MGDSPTREGPGYATVVDISLLLRSKTREKEEMRLREVKMVITVMEIQQPRQRRKIKDCKHGKKKNVRVCPGGGGTRIIFRRGVLPKV